MPALNCPYCRAFANFSMRHHFDHPFRGAHTHFRVWTCDSCGGPIIGRENAGEPVDYHPQYVAA